MQAVLNALISMSVVALDFAFIASTKWAVDIATGKAEGELRWAAAALIGVVVTRLLIGFSSRWVAAILGVRSQNQLQERLYNHLMHSLWRGREAMHTGDILNRMEHDVRDITTMLTEHIPAILAVLLRLGGAFVFLYSMDHALPFVLLLIAPSFVLLSKVYVQRMRKLAHRIRQTDSLIQSHLQESLQHRMVLQTLERCQTMVERLQQMHGQLRQQVKERTLFSSTSASLLSAGFSTGYLVAFLWGVTRLQDGTITYGTMLAFIQLVGQIQSPFREISRYIPLAVSCITSTERLMELEDMPLEETGEPVVMSGAVGVRLKDVQFAYTADSRQVLQHINYDFEPGTMTAVVGETGAGKTTLIRLILALVRPTSGDVEMYDDTRCVNVSACTRANIIYIPQGNTLLSGTIRENLLLGNPGATEEELRHVLEVACAEFVLELPEGMDAHCGEMGAGLSEGQSQRIAIARSLLRKGNLVILDEATSALDAETEQHLLHNLAKEMKGQKTIICITHRPAIMTYCTHTLQLKREG